MQRLKLIYYVMILPLLIMGCDGDTKKGNLPEAYLPDNAETILKISNFQTVRSAAAQNELINNNTALTFFSWLSPDALPDSLMRPVRPSYLVIHRISDSEKGFTWITRKDSTFVTLDSILGSEDKPSGSDNLIKNLSIDSLQLYVHKKDSLYIIGNDSTQIRNILNQPPSSGFFQRDLAIGNNKELIVNKQQPQFALNDSIRLSLTDESAIQLNISASEIKASGVLLKKDSSNNFIELFKGQLPQPSDLSEVIPIYAEQVNSFSYSDLEMLATGLQNYRSDSLTMDFPVFFEGVNQIAEMKMGSEHALILSSIDGFLTEEQLASYLTEDEPYRNIALFTFEDSELFIELFQPLISSCRPGHAFRIDNHFFFTEKRTTAEELITAISNKNTLAETPFFQNIQSDLSSSSTFEQYYLKNEVANGLANLLSKPWGQLENHNNYPVAVTQISNDRDFAHFNFITREIGDSKQISSGISQRFSVRLENDILVGPQLFNNHRSGGKDIVIQDIANNLQLYTSNGKLLWTRDLKEPIVGKIHEVDILRNGKKQLAFATARRLYVVDRNGKEVRPFPVKFDKDITQPMAVFDYDNNRKYRFALVQGKSIRLYDSKAKVVTGFTFSQAGSEIVLPPRHLRINNKDYILLAEQNGRLNILSRTGKPRITVSKEFKFSSIPLTREGNDFVIITADNTKHKINSGGSVNSQKMEVSGNYFFEVVGRTKATLDDNLLRINGQLVELPYGIYSSPKIYRIKGKSYVVVSESQDSKIYLYNEDGTLYPGFPVFGMAETALGYDSKIGLQVVARGDQKEIVLYQIR